ncbi:alpha-mannosyltransferase [Microthyrium microscopicum]|uniref:Alpha-mannosyltransferase n=1 Tax=Microthyrium microscopicum TaxID=703497 RepID=A0A6A6UUA8_9PEZI|nr:alpha-mannosyltransferase [Microthyrium microscopicum]
MSLSRSPSPQRGGGWSSPGLTTPVDGTSRRPSPVRYAASPSNVSWKSASSKSDAKSFSTYSPRGQKFQTHMRKISANIPFWNSSKDYADKEGRGRRPDDWQKRVPAHIGRMVWKLRAPFAIILAAVALFFIIAYPLLHTWRRTAFLGGGSKYVIMLATNLGGGVMEWKGPREWAIERDSVKNKKAYAKRWGYELEMVDMSTKKRYAHEWRESWEKVDTIRNTMRKYPNAEWFWWLDLHTFIMEPTYSLQSHIFNDIQKKVYRDINVYNPLNISHPPTDEFLDPISRSAIGDGKADSINLLVPQDCGGFNLGSFLIRRSAWTDRLLDIWWDPVGYEQKHMEWEHKEQDALEWMYTNQPWVRSHFAFLPQRSINSFPPGACNDKGPNTKIHYDSADRDFLVNMAGCEWGRDCWGEMFEYRKLSESLNRNALKRFWDWVKGTPPHKSKLVKS